MPLEHPKQLSPLTLAFLGDGVYELAIRRYLVEAGGSMPPKKLHNLCVQHVRASAQCRAVRYIYDRLTEEERQIYKRGRNASGVTVPKNASPAEYRAATGLEALVGYLDLKGETARLNELIAAILEMEEREGPCDPPPPGEPK